MIIMFIGIGAALIVIGGVILKIRTTAYYDDAYQSFDHEVFYRKQGKDI